MAASTNERVRKRRAALRQAGLRPIQLWVPDTRRPSFPQEARRQSARLRDDPQERDVLDWIDSASDTEGWRRSAEIWRLSRWQGMTASLVPLW
ncbi:antitoxin MazE family protein [Aquisalimonas sp.]|uniref:antitoxin MazE family protein n=1 Tax=Aquisalimonas sp. TaxID=1872621 RepID=UPI0025B8D299|nr:antitoxin MazE family protein [Aquisalimonas sp.]